MQKPNIINLNIKQMYLLIKLQKFITEFKTVLHFQNV